MNYRLYTFVAHLYLSELQRGLQTAHVVSEMYATKQCGKARQAFGDWAENDKTIIICGAGTHSGVLACYAELKRTGDDALCLPSAIFREDEDSMNSMATACGIVVPQKYWDAKFDVDSQSYMYCDEINKYWLFYPLTHVEGQFIQHLKSFRLA